MRGKEAAGVKVIGITGGVGAGKSAVLKYLAEKPGVRVVEADEVGHLLMEPGTEGFRRIREHFGEGVIREDGTLDRAAVAKIVFSDEKELAWQSGLMHPAVKQWIREAIEEERTKGNCRLFVVEAALLIENGFGEVVDEMWYIYAREEVRRKRLSVSRGYTPEKIDRIMSSQLSENEFRKHCDFVIDNSDSLENSYRQIRQKLEAYTWRE